MTMDKISDLLNEAQGEDAPVRLNMSDIYITEQVRSSYSEAEIEELAETIKKHGLIQPIEVRPRDERGYPVRAGHRRFLAHQRAGLDTIQAFIKDRDYSGDASSNDEIIIQLIENVQRVDLSPLDLARSFLKLKTGGLKNREISKEIGKKESYISKVLSLNSLPESVAPRLSAICSDLDALYKFADLWKSDVAAAVKLLEKGEANGALTRADVNAAKAKSEKEQQKTPPANPVGGTTDGEPEEGDASKQLPIPGTELENPTDGNSGGMADPEKEPNNTGTNEKPTPVNPDKEIRFLIEIDGEKGYWEPRSMKDNVNTQVELLAGGILSCAVDELKILKAIND